VVRFFGLVARQQLQFPIFFAVQLEEKMQVIWLSWVGIGKLGISQTDGHTFPGGKSNLCPFDTD